MELNAIKFHNYVRTDEFDKSGILCFSPPDGKFEFMSYKLETKVKPLFSVKIIPEVPSKNTIKLLVIARSNFKERVTAKNVEIFIPIAADLQNTTFKCSHGFAIYSPSLKGVQWTFDHFPGKRLLFSNVDNI